MVGRCFQFLNEFIRVASCFPAQISCLGAVSRCVGFFASWILFCQGQTHGLALFPIFKLIYPSCIMFSCGIYIFMRYFEFFIAFYPSCILFSDAKPMLRRCPLFLNEYIRIASCSLVWIPYLWAASHFSLGSFPVASCFPVPIPWLGTVSIFFRSLCELHPVLPMQDPPKRQKDMRAADMRANESHLNGSHIFFFKWLSLALISFLEWLLDFFLIGMFSGQAYFK